MIIWISSEVSAVQTADSSQMTHAEAVNLCQSLGGRLATYRELSDARAEGYHLCRFVIQSTASFS